jgi:hypothetical protein
MPTDSYLAFRALEFGNLEFRSSKRSAPEFIHERQNLLASPEHFSDPFVD